MPHVTFVHGIGNKPPADDLLGSWRGALADVGSDLATRGVSSSLVYWADLLYAAPVRGAVYESAEDPEIVEVPDVGMLWAARAEDDEAVFIRELADAIGYDPLAADAPAVVGDELFERVPLPWFLKRRLMKVFLRDVHHYLFDTTFNPRPGEEYSIRRDIRARVVEALAVGARKSGPHVVVAHSLGSVIAYDCLRRVADCPRVDGLVTIGSPLGLDEVQDRLRPEWSRADGFPEVDRWVNVYDRLDPVVGLDPVLGNDFRRDGTDVVEDVHQANRGAWRHSATKYLAGEPFRRVLDEMVGL